MKKILLFLLMGILIGSTYAQQYPEVNQIVLAGKAKLIVPANRASFSFEIIGYGSKLREAVNEAKSKMSKAINILSSLGVKKNEISTSFFQSDENPNGSSFLSSSEDYRTNIKTNVIVSELDSLEQIIFLLSESEVTKISNIVFSLKDYTKYEEEVRLLAIADVKRKAAQYAKEFGIKSLKIIYISGSKFGMMQKYPNPFNPTSSVGNLDEVENINGIYAQSVKLTDNLSVIYKIE